MDAYTAVRLLADVHDQPGWEHYAGALDAGTIRLTLTFPMRDSSREYAPAGYPVRGTGMPQFDIAVADLDEMGLYRAFADAEIDAVTHEIREFLRVGTDYWAPFHPHRREGTRRWHGEDVSRATAAHDLYFGNPDMQAAMGGTGR
jgi:hypothetical protein